MEVGAQGIIESNDLLKCIQCGVCTGSCPVSVKSSLNIRRVMRDVVFSGDISIPSPAEFHGETDAKDLETRYHLGIAYKEMELIDHAIAEFEAASADTEWRFDCLVMLGICSMEKEEYDRAINYFNDASHVRELNKEEKIRLHYRMGLAYESNGMNQEALKLYHQVIDLDSTFLDVRNRIERLKQPS